MADALLPCGTVTRRMVLNRKQIILCCWFVLHSLCQTAHAQVINANLNGTVTAVAGGSHSELLPGATLVLSGPDRVVFKTVSDGTGSFAFPDLPPGTYTLNIEAKGFSSVTREIRLLGGEILAIEIFLTPTVSESVTVHDEEGLLSSGQTVTSNTVSAEKLEQLPIRLDNYQSALALTPSIVRDVDGKDHIKGTRAGENVYTVNGADVTDPVSGNLAFDIPLEAAARVHIEDNPYAAEFGRATGGATDLETKAGGNNFAIHATRFFPLFHNVIGGRIDSFRPRVTFEGPLIKNRLNFLQSFEYRFSRSYAFSLEAPHNDSTFEAFNSFTQLDQTINNNNHLTFVGAFFKENDHFVGLDTFNPQPTTPNIDQHGVLLSLSEQRILRDQSLLTSLLAYKTFNVNVLGQGTGPMILAPDGNTGSYFADTRRFAQRVQWEEQYSARTFSLLGKHSLKLGAEWDYTNDAGRFNFRPIEIRRSDQTLAERIDFTGPTFIDRALSEFGSYVGDHWVINRQVTIEGGIRVDRNSIANRTDISPRASVLFLPFHSDRTVVRAGFGVFYNRSPFSSRYFEPESRNDEDSEFIGTITSGVNSTNFPGRVVTSYGPDGKTIIHGPVEFLNVIGSPLLDARSERWSLQVDRRISKTFTLRAGYVHRYTENEPIVQPELTGNQGLLTLTSQGVTRYNEFQVLGIYNSPRFHNWTFSYVRSRAEGSLNTSDNFLSDSPAYVVRPSEYATLPFDAPHRFLAYGEIKAPHKLTVMPALEIRSGFPYSNLDEHLDFVGTPNSTRFPTFLSLDASILRSFTIPFLDKKARAGVVILNATHHFNPRDVQNNLDSLQFGQFFNSLGTSVRVRFDLNF